MDVYAENSLEIYAVDRYGRNLCDRDHVLAEIFNGAILPNNVRIEMDGGCVVLFGYLLVQPRARRHFYRKICQSYPNLGFDASDVVRFCQDTTTEEVALA